MHHTHTHTNRNNNTKHRQHNNPSQTNHHPATHRQQSTKGQNIVILQININGIRNKIDELKNLVHNTQPDIITIQETKLTQKTKTPKIPHYTTIRTDREPTRGGTVRRHTIAINYYPNSLLLISAGFLPRVSSQLLN